MTMIAGKENVDKARTLTLRKMLKLEVIGMMRRGPSAYSICKQEFNLKGSKKKVLEQMDTICEGILERGRQ